MRKSILNSVLAVLQCVLILLQFGIVEIDERISSFSNSSQDVKIFSSANDLTNFYYENNQRQNDKNKQDQGPNQVPLLESVVYSYYKYYLAGCFYSPINTTVEQEYLRSSDLKSPPYNS